MTIFRLPKGAGLRVVWTLKSHRVWLSLLVCIFLMGLVSVLCCMDFTLARAVVVGFILIGLLVQLRSVVIFCRPLALVWDGASTWWLEYRQLARRVDIVQVGWLSRWVVTLQCELPDGSGQWLVFFRGVHSPELLRRLQFQMHCRFR